MSHSPAMRMFASVSCLLFSVFPEEIWLFNRLQPLSLVVVASVFSNNS